MGTNEASVKLNWKTFAPLAVWLMLYPVPVPEGLQLPWLELIGNKL